MPSLQAVFARRAQLRGALALPPTLVVPKAWFDSSQNFTGATWRSRIGGLVVEQPMAGKQFSAVDAGLLVNPSAVMSGTVPFDFSGTQSFTILLKLTTVTSNGPSRLRYYNLAQTGTAINVFGYSYNNSYEGQYDNPDGICIATAGGQEPGAAWWAANDVASGRTRAMRTYTQNVLATIYPLTAAAAALGQFDFEIGNREDASTGTFALRHMLVFDQLLTGSERQAWMDYLP
jgi:hypothetical protein